MSTKPVGLQFYFRTRPAARDTIQQVIALNEHLGPHLRDDHTAVAEDLLGLRKWASWCMNQLGDSAVQAIEHAVPLVAEYERLLGPDHPTP